MNRARASERIAFTVAFAVLALGIAGFHAARGYLDVILTKEPAPLRHALRELPTEIGVWKRVGPDETLSAEMVEELGTEQYVSRCYAPDGDLSQGWLQLHVAFYTGIIDAVPHIPERCFGASGFQRAPTLTTLPVDVGESDWVADREGARNSDGQMYRAALTRSGDWVRMPWLADDGLRLNASEYWRPESPDHHIAAGYFFIANGRATALAAGVKALAFRPQDTHAYYCKVQLTYTHPERSISRDELATVAGPFLAELLPELMRILPDWYEVEIAGESGQQTVKTHVDAPRNDSRVDERHKIRG